MWFLDNYMSSLAENVVALWSSPRERRRLKWTMIMQWINFHIKRRVYLCRDQIKIKASSVFLEKCCLILYLKLNLGVWLKLSTKWTCFFLRYFVLNMELVYPFNASDVPYLCLVTRIKRALQDQFSINEFDHFNIAMFIDPMNSSRYLGSITSWSMF